MIALRRNKRKGKQAKKKRKSKKKALKLELGTGEDTKISSSSVKHTKCKSQEDRLANSHLSALVLPWEWRYSVALSIC